jgi:hypothetical protein
MSDDVILEKDCIKIISRNLVIIYNLEKLTNMSKNSKISFWMKHFVY